MGTVAYISMAFGNPYGDPWNETEVVEAVRLLFDMGITQISLADTVGLASAQQVSALVKTVAPQFPEVELGVHLHSRPEQAAEKVLAAYDAGARRFDCALGGLGGCPFAQDLLVGNIPTERVLEALGGRGVPLPLKKPLDAVLRLSAEIQKIVQLPDVRERYLSLGLEASAANPDETANYLRKELARYGEIARKANIRMD